MPSKISWTDQTWEPSLGCSRVSQGCMACYAERLTNRFAQNPVFKGKYEGLVKIGAKGPTWNGTVRTVPEALTIPLRWKTPRKVFVCSRSDLFHKDVPFEFIAAVFGVMALTPAHTYQVLTKRPERMVEFFVWLVEKAAISSESSSLGGMCIWFANVALQPRTFRAMDTRQSVAWPLPNVWLGTSVEHQEAADERIPFLVQCPAHVRFVSVEPLLGHVDLSAWTGIGECPLCQGWGYPGEGPDPTRRCTRECRSAKTVDSPEWEDLRLHWIIVGAESGPGARPMEMAWALALRDQCKNAGVAYYFKQQNGQRSNERPYLVEDNGKCIKIQQYPVHAIGGLHVTGEPEEVLPK